MTIDLDPRLAVGPSSASRRLPLTRAAQIGGGLSLALAGLLNGGAQYVGHLVIGDLDFSEQIRWGAAHPAIHGAEQLALLVSTLFLPIGVLALAHLTRQQAPRVTAVGIVLTTWGFWGFHNVLALGYTAGTIAPSVLGVENAIRLNHGLIEHPGAVAAALVPHLLGSFLGLLFLSVAGWRGSSLPRIPLVLLVAFLIWDFFLPPVGPFEAHLLLAVSFVWLGIHVLRMPSEQWRGGTY